MGEGGGGKGGRKEGHYRGDDSNKDTQLVTVIISRHTRLSFRDFIKQYLYIPRRVGGNI